MDFGRCVIENYYHPRDYWETPAGRADLDAHVLGRLGHFRKTLIPWLDRTIRLDGARILEIGCGTGASTVALAEQGASVLGVDIDAPSLVVAKQRCALHGVSAAFQQADAAAALAGSLAQYDLVVFWAVLEHMTHAERLAAIRAAWEGLRPGTLMAVVDTPNRLWYFDPHTSNLPFFHWLPDEIARRYTGRCDRAIINEIYALPQDEGLLTLQRWGRGISYHDFELALDGLPPLAIESVYGPYERIRFLPKLAKWYLSVDRGFNLILRKVAPNAHPAFCEPYLDFIARKL